MSSGWLDPAPPVVPEVDHLLGHRLGRKSRLTFYALGLSRVATTDRRHFEPLAAALSLQLLC
jgi:hypothetical protein